MKLKSIFIIILSLFLGFQELVAQQKIKVENANTLRVSPRLGRNVQVLIGNVRISTQGAVLTCDSAYFYQKSNALRAFGNTKLSKRNKGDNFTVTGNSMYLNGNTNIAQVRDSVKLVSKDATLTTNFFDYNLKSEEGHFWNRGKTVSTDNTFISDKGYFYAQKNTVVYQQNVKIDNPQYKITTDKVIYNTETKVSQFLGHTKIINEDNIIDCQRAYINQETDESAFAGNVYLNNKGQIIQSDSVHYNRKQDLGRAYGHISVVDTAQNIVVKGNYADYSRNPSRMKVANKAYFMQYSDNDTLFVHGDTISTTNDTVANKKAMFVYNHVKIYNKSYQAKCDSMVYSDIDSTIRLIGTPILWADSNQLTAQELVLHTRDKKIERLELITKPFITFPESDEYYNQIKGKKIVGYIKNNKLQKIEVESNAESIYYPKDSASIMGHNKTASDKMIISMGKNRVQKVAMFGKVTAKMNPLKTLTPEDFYLRGFQWMPEFRPKKWEDIFAWKEK